MIILYSYNHSYIVPSDTVLINWKSYLSSFNISNIEAGDDELNALGYKRIVRDFNNDGNPDSEDEIYQAFREKFTDLASGEKEDFQFSCDSNFDGNIDLEDTGDINWEFIPLISQDGDDFVSSNPIASILLIEAEASGFLPSIATDDGAIMVSDFTNNYWTISTISTPSNGTQPFSGNRQWGWLINQSGNFEFFSNLTSIRWA